jgi:hypothetical protein
MRAAASKRACGPRNTTATHTQTSGRALTQRSRGGTACRAGSSAGKASWATATTALPGRHEVMVGAQGQQLQGCGLRCAALPTAVPLMHRRCTDNNKCNKVVCFSWTRQRQEARTRQHTSTRRTGRPDCPQVQLDGCLSDTQAKLQYASWTAAVSMRCQLLRQVYC